MSRNWKRYLRFADADLSRPIAFAVLAIVFVIMRLPFVGYGHGTDPDAWRVALSAHYLLETGDYFPSRLPGNPLHELLMTLFIPGGWIATNLATVAASLGGVYLFARIVRLHALPNAALLVVGFAFAPLLLINSVATMDYMWALTCILGAYYGWLTGKPLWSGVLLGLSVGFRMQSGATWFVLVFLAWREGRLREVAPLTFAAAGVALLAYAPVLVVYGTDFFNYYAAAVDYDDVLRLLGKEALGILGVAGVVAGVLISLPRLRHLPGDLRRDAYVAAWVGMIAIFFLSFSNLPHEIAYLIPVFPFGLLLMGRYFSRLAIATSVAAILLAGVVDVTTPGDELSPGSLRDATVGKGLILSNAETMDTQRRFVRQIIDADKPDHAIVMTGFIFPQLAVRQREHLDPRILHRDYGGISMLTDRGEAVDTERDVRYVWLTEYETFLALRSQGYSFFLVPDAARSAVALYKYRPTLFGATYLELDLSTPSIERGSGTTDR